MDYLLHIMILVAIYSIFAISLNLEMGYTGLYNFGHVAFFGIGAYASALLSLQGTPVWFSMVCAMMIAGGLGALIAVPALRLTGDYFGIATLVFAEMVRLFFLNERGLTRGSHGIAGYPPSVVHCGGGSRVAPVSCLLCDTDHTGMFLSYAA